MMNLERIRLSLAAVWLFVALYIATDLHLSWATASLLIAVGLIPPIALFGLWNRPGPIFGRRSHDPRSS
jgi:hypothetical protein